MLNICRRDHEGSKTHCWRVEIRRQSRTYRRSFSDGRYGGRANALQAALAYRDQVVAAHPRLARSTYCAIVRTNNRSGISGLTRVDRVELSGRPQRKLYWEAQVPLGQGCAQHRRFSIRKYGEEGAYQRALAVREGALRSLSAHTFSPVEARISRVALVSDLGVRSSAGCVPHFID